MIHVKDIFGMPSMLLKEFNFNEHTLLFEGVEKCRNGTANKGHPCRTPV
jgi:hypothetical protein